MRFSTTFGICVVLGLAVAPRAERKIAAFGLLGGINWASFHGQDVHDVSQRFWPVVGADLTFNLPQILGLEVDVLYASRGGAFKAPDTGTRTLVNTIKLHTLTVPILFKITLPIGKEAHPMFVAGPAFAVPLSQDATSESVGVDAFGQINSIPATSIIPKDEMRDYDLLITVGAGLEWGMGNAQLRANMGQASLDKRDQADVRTFTLELLAGFTF